MAYDFNVSKRWIAVLLGAGAVATVAFTTISATTGTFTGTVQAEQLTSTDDALITDDLDVNGLADVAETITAGTGITATTGDIAATAGNVTAGAAVSATTTVTGGTGITATTGDISATAGNVAAGAAVTATTTVTGGTGLVATTGDITASAGDLVAVGGFRQQVGPFTDTLAASQTDTVLVFGIASHGWISQRAGSIVGFSCQLSGAVTGSTKQAAPEVAINGTAVAGDATALTFTSGGAEVKLYGTYTKGTHALAAGDIVTVVYTSDAITNTPTVVCDVEIEQ